MQRQQAACIASRMSHRGRPSTLSLCPCCTATSSLFSLSAMSPSPLRYLQSAPNGRARGTGFWQNKQNVMKALQRAEQKLGLTKPEDWYTVTVADLHALESFPSGVTRVKLAELLKERYPDHNWEQLFLRRGRFAQQKRLENALVSLLFSDTEVLVNARKEAGLIDPETGHYIELDFFIPALMLAFEFQERHHYVHSEFVTKPLEEIKHRDKIKHDLAKQSGISLITIPCWWDGRLDSLISTIKKLRPDLAVDMPPITGDPIPEEPPPHFFEKLVPQVEGVGEPTTACFFTLSNIDPKDWWLFEKYDGVRGFWNPEKKAFFSRNGNKLPVPQEVIDSMPRIYLDGEIWFGRDSFQEALRVSSKAEFSRIDWSKFKYMVFDLPTHRGTYAERYQALEAAIGTQEWPFLELAKKKVCKDVTHLEKLFQDILEKGGEGVILRDPHCPYQAGRSAGYLKHKKFRDGEARIVAAVGQHQWECELPNGVRFLAPPGTTEFAKRWTPQPGDIVSFKHRGFLLNSRKPKLPVLYRLRTDITWEQLKFNWVEKIPKANAWPLKLRTSANKPKGYWLNLDNRRKFLLQFAEERGFDPSKLENWRQVNDELRKRAGGLLTQFNGLKKALHATFPEWHTLVPDRRPPGYWQQLENREAFFLELAKELDFDPMIADNWVRLSPNRIYERKGRPLLDLYGGSLKMALQNTFPSLNLRAWPILKRAGRPAAWSPQPNLRFQTSPTTN